MKNKYKDQGENERDFIRSVNTHCIWLGIEGHSSAGVAFPKKNVPATANNQQHWKNSNIHWF